MAYQRRKRERDDVTYWAVFASVLAGAFAFWGWQRMTVKQQQEFLGVK